MCRYLSTEQIRRLYFPARTETPADKRLRQLAGIGKYGFPNPFVERTIYRNYAGELIPVWKPTPSGYMVAVNIIETEVRSEVLPDFQLSEQHRTCLATRLPATFYTLRALARKPEESPRSDSET
jgi:hypothetical protein